MSRTGMVRSVDRWWRRHGPRTEARLLGLRARRRGPRGRGRLGRLRHGQHGQGALEYLGLVVIVTAIVGALVATGLGAELTQKIGTQICKVTSSGNCGGDGGDGTQAQGDDPGTTNPATDNNGSAQPKSQAQIDYEKALQDLENAKKQQQADTDKAKQAAEELAKILAEELGIKAAFDCITKGDMGACTETLINVLTSLIGGAIGKLAAKYGAPWKWKKAAELIKKLKKHGGDLYDSLKNLIKNRNKVSDAQKKADDAKRKLDAEKKDPPKEDQKPDNKPTTCPVRHSFPPGTPVLLADGRRVAIERVQVGDKVLATEPYTGRTAARPVEQAITTHDDKDFTRLTVRTVGGPAVLTVTDTHPFWVMDQGRWRDAGEIRRGDTLRSDKGVALPVVAVSRFTERQTTHDLTVADIHTYYVVAAASGILVHNEDGAPKPTAQHQKLQNIINTLYKGVGHPDQIGDGSAMAAADYEANGGPKVEGKDHVGKAKEMRDSLKNFLTATEWKPRKGAAKQPLIRTPEDEQLARTLIKALDDAIEGKYKGHKNYPGLDC
ncbi:polymorphic toxin-type HINT domain-containing protein [Streptomyces purpureus]|uniref:polymorphic toxin-type HINT domain-containing protein n=1 Tax=Streptomyces purpureus TaxID=1951 RepID=UPI003788F97E